MQGKVIMKCCYLEDHNMTFFKFLVMSSDKSLPTSHRVAQSQRIPHVTFELVW